VWFDEDVHRLNSEGRGRLLGAFKGDDRLLVWTPRCYYVTGYDMQQHFPDDTLYVERYQPERVYAVCYYDKEQHYYYLKRFNIELSDKLQSYLDEEGTTRFICRTGRLGAQLEITYAGAQASRPAEQMDVDSFVGVKSHRAKGKRITTYEVNTLRFIEPIEAEPDEAESTEPTPAQQSVDKEAEAVELTIERPRGDQDDVVDVEQLDLF
jgi:topoisomerase-4 subunit A